MKKTLTATDVRVVSFRGNNRQPNGGWATFSDGKHFGFGLNVEGTEFTFTVYRRHATMHNVKLPKRSAAIQTALESGMNVDMSPMKVSLG